MKEKKSILTALPVLFGFFVMGFCDIVGISSDYVQRSFGWSPVMTGFVPSMVFIWFLFLGIPVGNLMNKWGRKNTVLISMIITIVGMILPLLTYNSVTCMAAYALLGIGNAILQVSLNPLLKNVITNKALLTSSLTAGQVIKALSSLAGPEIVLLAVGHFGEDKWYYCFPMLGLVTLLSAIWLMATPIEREENALPDNNLSMKDTFALLKDRTIFLLFLGIFFVVGVDVATNFISSKLMAIRFGWTEEQVKFAPQVYFLSRTVGALLGVFLLARIAEMKYFRINIVACVVALLVLAGVKNEVANIVCIGAVGFFASSVFSIIYSMALQARPEKANQISGLMITAVAGGGIVTPAIGFAIGTVGIIGGVVVTLVCVLYLAYCAFGVKVCLFAALAILPAGLRSQEIPVYWDASKPVEERIDDALSRMTLEEKVGLLHADRGYGSAGVPRLGIPENNLTDGPSGLRPEMVWQTWMPAGMSSDSCTAFPDLECLAATWNPGMGYLFGKNLGEEALYRNKNMVLGPAVNIVRTPMNGRNFEYMGEDPYLASEMAVAYIKGVQENHVSACVKHFAANNQETGRTTINAVVDERTLHEIYLPAFKAAVQEGRAWAVMGAYNKLNGQHCCHNSYLLNEVLRKQWGFDGVVVSDFGGTHDTREAIDNGLDMEFGTDLGSIEAFRNYHLAQPYLQLLKNGGASEDVLNEKVRRILRMMYRTNMSEGRPWGSLASEEHASAARRIAEEGIVLLKNDRKILPLDAQASNRILVVGENALKMMSRDGGSSEVKSKYEVVPFEGIRKYAMVDYQPGYSSTASKPVNDSLQAEAVKAAKCADIVIYIGGMNKNLHQDCEGVDRQSYDLPYGQDALITALSGANPSLVAVMVCGNAYSMPWQAKVPAIVQAWYGGTEAGNAIASVLFGEVNPSGKLPFSFPAKIEDNPACTFHAYPGDGKNVEYKEGIFVGYRWFDTKKIKPRFAFGHGLSYTSFDYGKVSLGRKTAESSDSITVTIPVTNSGERQGAEVVQLYVRDMESSLLRPFKELKGFKKVKLAPKETVQVDFTLGKEALSFYDPKRHRWVVEPGEFQVLVGSASDDIRSSATFRIE